MLRWNFILLLLLSSASALPAEANDSAIEFSITTAPFEISRKYKSMEGPQVIVPVTLQLLQQENNRLDLPVAATEENPLVWIRDRTAKAAEQPKELWWFLGAQLEAIDPKTDQPVSQEFICHLNIDIDPETHAKNFPSSPGGSSRLLTLTGGATNFQLPPGFGIPIASDEPLKIYFQALNHNRTGHHTFRHRLTLRFAKDADLRHPITPLTFHWPSIAVPLQSEDKPNHVALNTCSCCLPATAGLNAPANPENGLFTGPSGRTFSGHWQIPPGTSTWTFPVNYYSPDFASYDTLIHALIPHLHPFAQKIDLIAHRSDCGTSEPIASLQVENRAEGVGLQTIETFTSPQGITLSSADEYELRVTYDNSSSETQDSMATLGIFTRDLRWQRPAWADATLGGAPPSCGIPPPALTPSKP